MRAASARFTTKPALSARVRATESSSRDKRKCAIAVPKASPRDCFRPSHDLRPSEIARVRRSRRHLGQSLSRQCNCPVPSKNNFDVRKALAVIHISGRRNQSRRPRHNSGKKLRHAAVHSQASWRRPAQLSAPSPPSRIGRHRVGVMPQYATFPFVGPRNESRGFSGDKMGRATGAKTTADARTRNPIAGLGQRMRSAKILSKATPPAANNIG
jgi:hypothetical protein